MVHEHMHKGACGQEKKVQDLNHMCPMLRPEEVANHQQETYRDQLGPGNLSLHIVRVLVTAMVVIHTFLLNGSL